MEILIDENNDRFVAEYSSDGQRFWIPEISFYKGRIKNLNNGIKDTVEEIKKRNKKKTLLLAGYLSSALLIGSGLAFGSSKLFGTYPTQKCSYEYIMVNEELDSNGKQISSTHTNKILENLSYNIDLYYYDQWQEENGKYYRNEYKYTTTVNINNSDVRLYLEDNIEELTKNKIEELNFKEVTTNKQEGIGLTEEELNEGPYIVMKTKYFDKKIEIPRDAGSKILGLLGCGAFYALVFLIEYGIIRKKYVELTDGTIQSKQWIMNENNEIHSIIQSNPTYKLQDYLDTIRSKKEDKEINGMTLI